MARNGVNSEWIWRAALCAAAMIMAVSGCGPSAPPARGLPTGAKLSNLTGTWKIGFTTGIPEGIDYDIAILELTPGKESKTYNVEVKSIAPAFGAAKLQSSNVTLDEIRIVFAGLGRTFEFVGHPGQKEVRGTMTLPRVALAPARLSPTELTSLAKAEPRPTADREAVMKAAAASDKMAAVQEFIKANPASPLIFDAYSIAVSMSKKEKLSEQDVQSMLDDCRKCADFWGPALRPRVDLSFGAGLARQKYLPDMARKLLEMAENEFNNSTPWAWELEALAARTYLGETGEIQPKLEKIREQLQADSETESVLPVVNYLLARAAEEKGDNETALALSLKLLAPPTQEYSIRSIFPEASTELPSEAVARLWKKIHGNTEGLDAAIRQANADWIRSFATKRPETTQPPGHVALLELFTGAQCAPCYAADIASEVLQGTFSESELIVIRYHMPIPGPDPLANNDTIGRYNYYRGQGTPLGLVDGKQIDQFYGFPPMIPAAYKSGRSAVETALKKQTSARLTLSSKPAEEGIAVTAEVEGLEGASGNLRLRLALVEDEIDFFAPNGIRYHNGVVRGMPGSIEGVSPQKGKLAFQATIPVDEVKQALRTQISQVERELKMTFPAKPLELKRLRLVAFLQDDSNRQVLQAAAISLGEQREPPTLNPLEATPESDSSSKPGAPE